MEGNSTTEDVDRILRYFKDALEVVGKGEADWMWTDKILVFEYCGCDENYILWRLTLKWCVSTFDCNFIHFYFVSLSWSFVVVSWLVSISDNFKTSRIRLYANDTKVYREIKDVRRDSQALQSDLNSLDKWAKTWQPLASTWPDFQMARGRPLTPSPLPVWFTQLALVFLTSRGVREWADDLEPSENQASFNPD